MRCRATRRRIADYIYGDLASRERARFEDHIARCPACREQLDLTRRALEALPTEPAPTLSEAERQEMMRSVRRALRTAAATPRGARRWAWSWATAVVVAAGLGAGIWYTHLRDRGPGPTVVQEPKSPAAPSRLGPAVVGGPHGEGEGEVTPSPQEPGPIRLAVADVEVEFVTRPVAQPAAAPIPVADNDMRIMP